MIGLMSMKIHVPLQGSTERGVRIGVKGRGTPTTDPYRSNNGPPITVPENRKNTCSDPSHEMSLGGRVDSWLA